ncbi:hypothetical protein TNCV_253101 [Trichonephila clavipes]|nr:hypothetical protein TNCV_253101 [Trichonephila clavipes]
MLSSVGLLLRKWASNYNELLNSIDSDMRLSNASLNIDNDNTTNSSTTSLNDAVPEERMSGKEDVFKRLWSY